MATDASRCSSQFTSRTASLLIHHWRATLVGFFLTTQVLIFLASLPITGRPFVGPDQTIYLYIGWLSGNGHGIPYLHVWEIKPPLAYELPALLAFLTGDHMTILVILSIILTQAAVLASVLLTGQFIYGITEDKLAALIGGAVLLSFPYFYKQGLHGFQAKTFLIPLGIAALMSIKRKRWWTAGATAAAAAGFWQMAVIFPLVALIAGFNRSYRAGFCALLGIATVALVAIVPFVLAGPNAIRAMITEVIFAPFIGLGSTGMVEKFAVGAEKLRYTSLVAIVGGGAALIAWRWRRQHGPIMMWVSLGSLWFAVQVFFIDFQSELDLVVAFMFVAIGYGLLVAQTNKTNQSRLIRGALVLVVVAVAIAMLWHFGPERYGLRWIQQRPTRGTAKYLYYKSLIPESCHIRMSARENEFIETMGSQVTDHLCGQYSLDELMRVI